MTFALAVLVNFAVMGRGDLAVWIGSLTLVPLFLLLFSGLYMFVEPYLARRRAD